VVEKAVSGQSRSLREEEKKGIEKKGSGKKNWETKIGRTSTSKKGPPRDLSQDHVRSPTSGFT